MSAVGTITSVSRASCGDNRTACWRVWIDLNNPRSLPDTGPDRGPHPWAVDLPRPDDLTSVAAYDAGDRIEVSTHGKRNVTITTRAGAVLTIRSYAPGVYDANHLN